MVIDYQRVKTLIKDFSLKKNFYTYLDVFLEVLAYLEFSLESCLNNLWHHQNNLGSFASTSGAILRGEGETGDMGM